LSNLSSPFDDTVRSLTEFGENYEFWFKTDDGCGALRASTPVRSTETGLDNEHPHVKAKPNPVLKDASACTVDQALLEPKTKKSIRRSLYPFTAEDTDESGKRSSSSGCFFSDEDDEFDDHILSQEKWRSRLEATITSTSSSSCMQERQVQTESDGNKEVMKKSSKSLTSASTMTSLPSDKNTSNRNKYYMLFVTFTLVSLFLSLVLTSKRPFHLELEYKRPPPV